METVTRKVRLPRNCETAIQAGGNETFACRYAYARSAESRRYGDMGQDYLKFAFDDRSFVFALCDGVSLSFFGDLAACYLGDALVAWLWASVSSALDGDTIRTALSAYARELVGPATDLVKGCRLPDGLSPLVREVLERKREQGSETTFVCGRLDRAVPPFEDGRAVLAWLGDSRLRLWGYDGDRTADLGGGFHTFQRWSSKHGPVGGEPHLFTGPVGGRGGLAGLATYTDGLAAYDEFPGPLSDAAVQDLIDRAGASAASDDIAFLEVWLKPDGPAEEGTPHRPGTGGEPGRVGAGTKERPPGRGTKGYGRPVAQDSGGSVKPRFGLNRLARGEAWQTEYRR